MEKSRKLIPKPKRPGLSKFAVTVISRLLEIIEKVPAITSKIYIVNDLLRYKNWCRSTFGTRYLVRNRQDVWDEIAKLVFRKNQRIFAIELGVAWGYLTWWWFSRYSKLIYRWDGFDRFTGLPREWRGLAPGTFDAQGKTPILSDERIFWHVGDIEDTINQVDALIVIESGTTRLILFDLDIYEPSLVAWNQLKSKLRSGDILYFDEAFDADERRLLEENVLPSGEFRLIASSWTSLAIEVIEMASGKSNLKELS